MISLNATLFVQVGLFLIFLFIMNRIMIQPIHRLIRERDEHVQKKRMEFAAIQEEVKRLADDYERCLKRAEQEARKNWVDLCAQSHEQAHKIIVDAQAQVVALREKVRDEVAKELAKARETLAGQSEALSYEVTQKLMGRRI